MVLPVLAEIGKSSSAGGRPSVYSGAIKTFSAAPHPFVDCCYCPPHSLVRYPCSSVSRLVTRLILSRGSTFRTATSSPSSYRRPHLLSHVDRSGSCDLARDFVLPSTSPIVLFTAVLPVSLCVIDSHRTKMICRSPLQTSGVRLRQTCTNPVHIDYYPAVSRWPDALVVFAHRR